MVTASERSARRDAARAHATVLIAVDPHGVVHKIRRNAPGWTLCQARTDPDWPVRKKAIPALDYEETVSCRACRAQGSIGVSW